VRECASTHEKEGQRLRLVGFVPRLVSRLGVAELGMGDT